MMKRNILVFTLVLGLLGLVDRAPGRSLSLEGTLRRALAIAPETAVGRANLAVARGRMVDARTRPSPEIEVEVEDVGLDRPGASESEYAFLVSRPIEPGSKRSRRIRVARVEGEMARAEAAASLLEYLMKVSQAFWDLVAQDARVRLAGEELDLASSLLDVARRRVEAGATAGIEEERAGLEHASARVDMERTRAEREAAEESLQSLLQLEERRSPLAVSGELDDGRELPSFEAAWQDVVEHHAGLESRERATEVGTATLSLARAESRPVWSVAGGLRHLAGIDEQSFVLGLSLPLGTARANRGKVIAARAQQTRAQAEFDVRRLSLRRELRQALATANRVRAEVHSLRTVVEPRAEKVFTAVKKGYRRGELTYPDLLAAKRTLVEAGRRRVTALIEYRMALLALERALGGSLLMRTLVEEVFE